MGFARPMTLQAAFDALDEMPGAHLLLSPYAFSTYRGS